MWNQNVFVLKILIPNVAHHTPQDLFVPNLNLRHLRLLSQKLQLFIIIHVQHIYQPFTYTFSVVPFMRVYTYRWHFRLEPGRQVFSVLSANSRLIISAAMPRLYLSLKLVFSHWFIITFTITVIFWFTGFTKWTITVCNMCAEPKWNNR